MTRRMLAWVVYPATMTGAVGVHAALQSAGVPILAAAYVAVTLAAGAVTLFEFAIPYDRGWQPRWTDVKNDLLFMVAVQMVLPQLLGLVVALTLLDSLETLALPMVRLWPRALSVWLQVALMLVVAELLRYPLHVAAHNTKTLWRLHAVHHSPKKLYWLNVGRFHPAEKALHYTLDTLPFLLVGVGPEVVALYFVFYAVNGFYQHSNVDVRYGPLNYLVSGPELHRWHHSKQIDESNRNYGNNLIVRSQAIQSYVQFSADPDAYYGRLLAIVSPAEEGTLESGTPYGSTSGFMYENMPAVARMKYVLPAQVFGITDYDLKYLLILRLAVTHRDITHIACANPSTLVKLLSVLATTRTVLLDDVTRGTFSRTDELSSDVHDAIGPRLACPPERVAELRPILSSPRPTFAQLWPELRLVSTWTGGSCRIPLAGVRPALPPGARVAELGYLSSELRGTLIADVERNVGIPTIQENFFEFVERDDWDSGRKLCLTVEQIERGKEYYVIATTGAGLYRYFMNDIVRVTGTFYATPAIEFVQKGRGVTNITGEKVYESQVIDAVSSTEEETGLVSEFFMMLADADHAVYRLVVECDSPTEAWLRATLQGIELRLGELNVEYAAKRASGRLRHLELLPVRPGTGDAYKQHCLQAGQREGQFKLVALQYQSDCVFPFADFVGNGPTDGET